VNIALFGGTFDPIHVGHLRAAHAAARKFRLDRILFVLAGNPPHKYRDRLTSFPHRFALLALACTEDRRFVPSLLEAPTPGGRPHYSIATARAVKHALGPRDRLFFLTGADAFLDLPHWREYRRLLELVNFIVVSRPGFESQQIWKVVPQNLMRPGQDRFRAETLSLRDSTIYVLRGVNAPVASRDIREAVRAGSRITGLVPPLVEKYIQKEGLYLPASAGHRR
jgi:nicotinate-nucleotide adenylyltransferase